MTNSIKATIATIAIILAMIGTLWFVVWVIDLINALFDIRWAALIIPAIMLFIFVWLEFKEDFDKDVFDE